VSGRRLGTASGYEALVYLLPPLVRYEAAQLMFRWPQSSTLVQQQVMAIDGITRLTWQRRLDEISEATVEITKADMSLRCGEQVGQVDPWRMELAVFRDGELVWQGPIVDIVEGRRRITIRARDVLAHLERSPTVQGVGLEDGDVDLTDLALGCVRERIFHRFSPVSDMRPFYDWMGVVPYVRHSATGIVWPGQPRNAQEPLSYSTPYEELRRVAEVGLNFTTLNRSMVFRGPATASTRPAARLQDQDFATELEVVVAGEDLVTWAYGYSMTRDEATLRQYMATHDWKRRSHREPPATEPSTDPQDLSPWGEHAAIFEGRTENESPSRLLQRCIGRVRTDYPVPVIVRVPDGAELSPDAPVRVNELVCGQRIDVAVTSYLRRASTPMRLASVEGEWRPAGERIAVSLVPVAGEQN
jgi:hypothetical protein